MDVVLKEWTKKCENMGVELTNDKYLFKLLFAYDQVIIAQKSTILIMWGETFWTHIENGD